MLKNVQLLRAIAALMVVVGHLQPLFAQVHPGLQWVGLGRAGVDLFFVISGFVMVYTTERSHPTPVGFAWRRIVRIVPLYWAVTLGVFGLSLAAPALLGASRAEPVWLLKSLAFVPFDKGDGTFNPLVPVGWSLNYEMFFYAVFAASLLAGRARYWLAAGLILLIAAPGLAGISFPGVAAQFYSRPIMAEFVAGMAIGAVYPRLPGLHAKSAAGAARLALALLFGVLLASGLAPSETLRVAVAVLASGGILLLALGLEKGGRATRSRAGLLVGDASYSIYLTHLFITQAVVVGLAHAVPVGQPALSAAAILLALTLVIAAGIVVFRLFELPVSRALRSRPAGVASRPPPGAAQDAQRAEP